MKQAQRKELNEIPYVDNVPSDGRVVHSYPYFDETKNGFITHIPNTDGTLTWVWAEPIESLYYAKSVPIDLNDIYLDFNNVLIQNYSYPTINYYLNGVIKDILNCSAFFEKYFIFHDLYINSNDLSIKSLISTEIEYFFGNIRSIYDLLQKIIKSLWKIETGENLPSSFADIVKQSDEDLKTKYGLSDPLINYYNNTKDLFSACKKIRDDINHNGHTVDSIFCDEDGFAIQNSDPIFSQFVHVWPIEKVKKNGLVSLLALASFITMQTIENLDNLSLPIMHSISHGPPLSNTYKVILRGPYINHLNNLDKYIDEQWYVPNKKWLAGGLANYLL